MTMRFSIAPALACALFGSAAAACSVTTEGEPPVVGGYATVYADDVPPNIETYPRVPYEGGYAYYANEHWYYPAAHGWVRFRDEPSALAKRKAYLQVAPPARRGPERENGEHRIEEAPPPERIR
jgi:hypothetical protein